MIIMYGEINQCLLSLFINILLLPRGSGRSVYPSWSLLLLLLSCTVVRWLYRRDFAVCFPLFFSNDFFFRFLFISIFIFFVLFTPTPSPPFVWRVVPIVLRVCVPANNARLITRKATATPVIVRYYLYTFARIKLFTSIICNREK